MTVTGDITTSSGSVELFVLPHESMCLIQTYGTFSGVSYEIDGKISEEADYVPLAFIDRSTYSDDADGALATQAAGKLLEVNCSGLYSVKLLATAYSSGTMKVVMKGVSRLPLTQIAGG
jgi:hypothetical protein